MPSKAQIIATIGPSSDKCEVLFSMIEHQVDAVRLNFSWGDQQEKKRQITTVRSAEKKFGRKILIIQDLPGPRIQASAGHTYDKSIISCITEKDVEHIKFGIEQGVDYIALSFVGSAKDVSDCKEIIKKFGGKQLVIAKIERILAVENIEEIIDAADAIMIARGDLGNEFPIEKIPFIQSDIIKKTNAALKPVIVATQMLLSMTEHNTPTRAEVTDVTEAILEGADVVMLSEETSAGKFPIESVATMEKIALETEKHLKKGRKFNLLGSESLRLSSIGNTSMGKFIVARHHESEWNKLGLWTGVRDRHLTPYGFTKSEEMGMLIKDIRIDYAFASMQVRSIETLASMLDIIGDYKVPTEHSSALNERDYGDYTGKNKWDVEKLIGTDNWEKIRREWDYPVPNGETLKMVYDRVIPYFQNKILPLLLEGKNVLMVAHGNSIRALMKYIENIPNDKIKDLEMLFGGVVIYDLDKCGHLISKEVKVVKSSVNA